MMDNKSRMMGDCQVRFRERLKLKCFCLLDSPLYHCKNYNWKDFREGLVVFETEKKKRLSQNDGLFSFLVVWRVYEHSIY
jgi:hypothetical protein